MSTTSATKPNLFASAKKKESSTAKTAAKKEVIVSNEQHPDFSLKLTELAEIRTRLKDDEARAKALESEIKEEGRNAFIKLFREYRSVPESFYIKGEPVLFEQGSVSSASFLVITMDKYATIDEQRAEELEKQFGEDTVSVSEEYSLNSEILSKHLEAISEAIMGIETMTDEEKVNLFILDKKHSVKKGAIDRLPIIKQEEQEAYFRSINPQVQLKYSDK